MGLSEVGSKMASFGASWQYADTSWWQAGARERQDGDQEGQVEPAWGAWRLLDGRYEGGVRVNGLVWGPTQTHRYKETKYFSA